MLGDVPVTLASICCLADGVLNTAQRYSGVTGESSWKTTRNNLSQSMSRDGVSSISVGIPTNGNPPFWDQGGESGILLELLCLNLGLGSILASLNVVRDLLTDVLKGT